MEFKAENCEGIHSGGKIIERQNKVKCTTLNEVQEQMELVVHVYMSLNRSGQVKRRLIKHIEFYSLLTGS